MAVVLIAGASGLFGSHAAKAFSAAGWQVRRYQRGTDMAAAAMGADVIVNALNPPMYHNWAKLIPEITAQAIAAARASGARLIVAANVYNFGAQPAPWGPQTPQIPASRKGAIRVQMEADYRASGLPVILLRGGDFMDAAGKSFTTGMALKGLDKGRILQMGAPDAPRAFAWLPDMARVAVALAERRESLPRFVDMPFAGLTFSADDLRVTLQRQMGRPLRFTRFAWWQIGLLSPVWELARELREMRYLYSLPHRLDPAPLAALLPDFRTTSLADCLAEVLETRRMQSENKG